MIFKQIESGGDRNYAYLIASEETMEAALIDPSPDPLKVINMVKEEKVEIKYIVNTHSHYDHSAGNDKFGGTKKDKSTIFINCGDDTVIKDGETLELGELILEFIHTPGHTEDSICIKVEDKLVTGDTLFVGKVGGTYGEEDSKTEFESLKKLILLPPDTEVWPGHNYGETPSSTIKFELANNPFIKRLNDFSEFLWLKQNWPKYKLEHGIK
ncbi:MAG: hydroxyacylglutathione hydrolase family protein [Actinobacteria bacterium]|nr:hydroxyacylglutathione hydrolase family protein [Actinomycetota bacterium]